MQGDIFGWRQTEDTSRLEAEDSQWTIPADETRYGTYMLGLPACSRLHVIHTTIRAWDPWTKRAYLLGRKVPIQSWCWEYLDMGWWAAITFFLGSILFVLGSTAAIFKAVQQHEEQQRWLLVWPYFIGALLYTAGCALLVTLSVLKHPRKITAPVDSRPESPLLAYIDENKEHTFVEEQEDTENGNLTEETQPEAATEDETQEATNLTSFLGRWTVYQPESPVCVPITQDQMSDVVAAYYVKDDFYHIRGDPWYLRRWFIDLFGALIIAVGSILYILSCGTELYKDLAGKYPDVGGDPKYWLIKIPNIVGGVCFVVGSAMYVLSVHRSWRVMVVGVCSLPWWILVINLAGSFGFLIGAAIDIPLFTFAKNALISNWLEIFVGYSIGSALFLVGSYLMIIEIGTTKIETIA